MLLQPAHQRQIVGEAPQQGHAGVGMGVDQAGQQNVVVEVEAGGCAVANRRFHLGQDGANAARLNRQSVMLQHLPFRFDRYDPAGVKQGGDGLRHGGDSPNGARGL